MAQNTPLTREQIKNIIEGKGAGSRIPMVYDFWTHPRAFGENEELVKQYLREYPNDIRFVPISAPDASRGPKDNPDYKWIHKACKKQESAGLDAQILIEDMEEELDDILAQFPDPNADCVFRQDDGEDGRYTLAYWWFCFFERHWSLRGMENALTDFYLYPDEVHKLYQALTNFYMRLMERSYEEHHADAVFTSDDIGTQTGPFFSEDIYLEFFKPYYKQLIDKAHSLGMHFWLHTCGNVEKFLPHFVDLGLDVIHPIQKYTMEEKRIAEKFGDHLCIWAGFDVQRTIPYGTPEDVRREVRFMIDTYARKDGRLMMTCGNGLTPDCPVESLHALLDETYHYGTQKMKELSK